MKLLQPGLEYYVSRLKENRPFAFAKYSDGEWGSILELIKVNCDGTLLSDKTLRKELIASLCFRHRGEGYHIALSPHLFTPGNQFLKPVSDWIAQNRPDVADWYFCNVFHRASERGGLLSLIEALRNNRLSVVVVGPWWLRGLRHIFPILEFIEVPEKDCIEQRESIARQILSVGRPAIVSISAGPVAEILISQLWPDMRNSFLIDFGSLWDPYCGVCSRKYHVRVSQEVMQRNVGQFKFRAVD